MKIPFLISFIAATLSITLAEHHAELDSIFQGCLKDAKVTEEEAGEFYSSDAKFDAATQNLKCHVKCLMEKLDQLKAGVVDVNKMAKDWTQIPELAEYNIKDPKVFANCKDEKGSNDCDTAYKIMKCVHKSSKAN